MDTTTAVVVVIIIFALIAVAAFLCFRQRGSAEIRGPFGTNLKVEGSQDPPPQDVGIRAHDIVSRSGRMKADDQTGRGVDARRVDAYGDVDLSSGQTKGSDDPKAQPPA